MTDARSLAVTLIEGAASTAKVLAATLPDPTAKLAASGAAALLSMVASLVTTLGVDEAQKAVQALVERRDEGIITAADLTADDSAVMRDMAEWYASDADEHPDE